jgi:hypothetical protein
MSYEAFKYAFRLLAFVFCSGLMIAFFGLMFYLLWPGIKDAIKGRY